MLVTVTKHKASCVIAFLGGSAAVNSASMVIPGAAMSLHNHLSEVDNHITLKYIIT